MMLTVEAKTFVDATVDEIAINFDDEGLEFLIQKLTRLRGRRDHDHLMTPAWGSYELTEEKQGSEAYGLVNHLRLVKF